MDLTDITKQMANNAATIRSLSQGITDEQAQWKPDPDTWSILQVINHLYDEEREDFRVRLDYILHRPGEPWPDIDPQGWVEHRGYNQRDFNQSLSNFLAERESSLNWLKGLPFVGKFILISWILARLIPKTLHSGCQTLESFCSTIQGFV